MKHLKLIVLFLSFSLGLSAQTYKQIGNTLQERIIGGDTSLRFNTGATGFRYFPSTNQVKNLISSAGSTDNSIKAIPFTGSSFTIIGDSFSESAGASSYVNGYSYKFMRALMNASDRSYPRNRGFGYHTIINAVNSTNGTGISTTGTYLTTGTVQSRLQLTAGQTVTVSGRSFNYFDVFYDASLSTGSLEFRINGVLVITKTLSGTGIQNTFPTIINTVTTKSSDVVTMRATGTVVILGIETLRSAQNVPLAYVMAKSGFGLQDFNTNSALDEIAKYVNFTSGDKKYLAIALGTNNIYQPERALTPTEYISNLSTLITGINTRCGSVKYFITVPARSNENVFPVIKSEFSYQNYVDAIVSYCKTNNYVCIRYDLTQLGTGNTSYLADNIHPNNDGHTILGAAWSSSLSIPYDLSSQPDEIPYTLQDVSVNGYSASANAAISTENIQIENTSADAERFFNINGAGSNKRYGYKLGGNFRIYENTGGTGTNIDAKDSYLAISGKTVVSSNSDAFLAKTNAESVLAQFENTGGYNSLFRLKNTIGFSDISKNMDGSLSIDMDDSEKFRVNLNGNVVIPNLSGSSNRPVYADSLGTLKIGSSSTGVTSVTSLNADIAVSNPTTAPVLTLNSSTVGGANLIVKRDGSGTINSTTSTSAPGANLISNSGPGVLAVSTSGIAVSAVSDSGKAGRFETSTGTGVAVEVVNNGTGDLISGSNTAGKKFGVSNIGGVTGAGDFEITDFSKGVILRASDNSRWRITVSTTGVLSTTLIP